MINCRRYKIDSVSQSFDFKSISFFELCKLYETGSDEMQNSVVPFFGHRNDKLTMQMKINARFVTPNKQKESKQRTKWNWGMGKNLLTFEVMYVHD